MEITSIQTDFIPAAAEMFVADLRRLRSQAPTLPERMTDPEVVAMLLEELFEIRPGVAAVEDGRLVGFMGWYIIDEFRSSGRRAAYCPEWAHAAESGRKRLIYPAMYREAARQWLPAGCNTHAVTLLANDDETIDTWFWSGFGLAVVDAVRPMARLDPPPASEGFSVRQAGMADIELLVQLEAEHKQHYAQPPVLMASSEPSDAEEIRDLISDPENSFWLAEAGGEPLGYMRFEASAYGAAAIVESEQTAANTGAYVHPDHRGKSIAPALLDAALQYYIQRDYICCSVDFESFNPEAARFWMRYFKPVAFSLIRVPERKPEGEFAPLDD